MNETITDKLIHLSKTFKEGFTVQLKEGNIYQYDNTNKPYVISYRTLITINNKIISFKSVDIPIKCIIGGWRDPNTNIYHIELNKVYKNRSYALKMAKKHKQKTIYDSLKGVIINV